MSETGVTVINGSNDGDKSRSTSPNGESTPKKKRFQNGWTREQERLMSDWSDIAICYRWLHDKSDKTFHVKTLMISLPVIFLSTISGFSNVGVQAILESEDAKKYASFVIAAISLFAGLLTTVGDRLRYAQMEESHRVAGIAWGKFQRLIAVELALKPDDRMDALDFLKICRADLDRLIEQSPPIPKESIAIFETRFGNIKDLKKPDVCGALEHTTVFQSSESRLKQMAVDAALMLKRKRQTLNELVSPQIEQRITEQIDRRLGEAIEDRKRRLEIEIELKREEEQREREEKEKALEERKKKIQEEIELEKAKLYQAQEITETRTISPKRTGSNFESRLNIRRPSASTSAKAQPASAKAQPAVKSLQQSLLQPIEEVAQNIIVEPKDPKDEALDNIIIISKD
jgi:hypothetical protein